MEASRLDLRAMQEVSQMARHLPTAEHDNVGSRNGESTERAG